MSKSSVEAKYRAMAAIVRELLLISYVLKDFQVPVKLPILFFCDSQATVHISANPVFHERTNHLDIDCHIVCDYFQKGFVLVAHVSSSFQLANPVSLVQIPFPAPTCGGVENTGLIS